METKGFDVLNPEAARVQRRHCSGSDMLGTSTSTVGKRGWRFYDDDGGGGHPHSKMQCGIPIASAPFTLVPDCARGSSNSAMINKAQVSLRFACTRFGFEIPNLRTATPLSSTCSQAPYSLNFALRVSTFRFSIGPTPAFARTPPSVATNQHSHDEGILVR